MKKVLLPIDFSDQSKVCLQYAQSIAAASKAELLFVHAYGKPKISEGVSENVLTESEAIDKLKQFVELSDTDPVDVNTSYVVKVGLAADVILGVAENERVDLVVMGTTGTSKILNRHFGGVSMTLMNKAQCPILLIPPAIQFNGWKHFGCTINFEFDDLLVLHTMIKWSKKLNAKVTCLHVLEEEGEEKEVNFKLNLLAELFEDDNVEFLMKKGDVNKSIELFETEQNLSLLAMVHHKKNFIGHLLYNNTTEAAAEHSSVPLLVYNLSK